MGPQRQEAGGRIWRFASCEVDEMGRQLRVKGAAVEVESKPFDVLVQLLLRAGEVVTKEELLEAVWPGVLVVDGSLATAISKLRKAMEEDGAVILTMPRVGYRLSVPVTVRTVAVSQTQMGLKAGDAVQGREQWKLLHALDATGTKDVWLAEHAKTRELRVFKFAWDGVRLTALKREVTLWRYLRESLGERPEFVRLFEWNFEAAPFFVESEYGGVDLLKWAEERGGLDKVPLTDRLAMLSAVARAVAEAHGVGVLHKDLKPANVLVRRNADGRWQPQVADFGSAAMLEPGRLREFGITNMGFGTAEGSGSPITGTLLYMAPEVLGGQSPTASADVFALGVMLYQVIVGDFRAPLTPGWEARVADPLLREDIALAANGDVALRLSSAAELATRLETLEFRRKRRDELEDVRSRALVAEQRLTEARVRRPWVLAAVAASVIGCAISTVLYVRAARDRNEAQRQTAIATAANDFLENDLLSRSDPFKTGNAEETVTQAILQASRGIDAKFAKEPLIAARLHHAIARALDNRTSYAAAAKEYERTEELYRVTGRKGTEDALVARLQHASMEARSYMKDSMPAAKKLLAEAAPTVVERPSPLVNVWLHTARGTVALVDNEIETAKKEYQAAIDGARGVPSFDEHALLILEQRLAFCLIRLGDGVQAEARFRDLVAKFTALNGPESGDVLRLRLNLAQAYMIQGKHQQVVAETSDLYPRFARQLGEDHELTMQLLTTRAQSEGSLGEWKQAAADDLAIHDRAVRKQGPSSFYAVATLSDAALAQCRGGELAVGTKHASESYESSKAGFGERAALTQGTAYTLGFCLMEQGQLDRAREAITRIDPAAVAQLAADTDWGANLWLLEAQIAARKGDAATARTLLAKAKPGFAKPRAEQYQKDAVAALEKQLGA